MSDFYCDEAIPGNTRVKVVAETEEVLAKVMAVVRSVGASVEKEHGACRVLTNLVEHQDSKHLHFHVAYGASFGRNVDPTETEGSSEEDS